MIKKENREEIQCEKLHHPKKKNKELKSTQGEKKLIRKMYAKIIEKQLRCGNGKK